METETQRTRSLKARIFIPMLLMLTAVSLLIGISAYVQQRSVLTQVMQADTLGALPKQMAHDEAATAGQPEGPAMDPAAMFADQTVGREGYMFVLAPDGTVLYHPQSGLIGQNIAPGNAWVYEILKEVNGQVTYVWQDQTFYANYQPWGDNIVVATVPTSEYYSALNGVIMVIGITILVAIGLGAALVNTIVETRVLQPLREMESTLQRAGEGDLSQQLAIVSNDEIGALSQGVNAMIGNLRDTLAQVASVIETLARNAREMAAGSQEAGRATEEIALTVSELAQAAERQSTTTADSAQKVEGILAALTEANQRTQATSQEAESAVQLIKEGNAAVDLQQEKMQDNLAASTAVGKAIEELQQRVAQIGQFSDAIAEIASQTNLLALNAAIEASRAGDAGRGFAVVAEEVRSLADQSANAANEISILISEVEQSTAHAVEQMDIAGEVVALQSQAVNSTSQVFKRIDQAILNIIEQIRMIAAASDEVIEYARTVATSIEELAAISEQSAASSEEVAASTQEQNAAIQQLGASVQQVSSVAESLRQMISRFKM
jgi:methyl-accepting chemotaxis protein